MHDGYTEDSAKGKLIAEQVFKRSQEGSEDHSRRSKELSRSQRRKSSLSDPAPKYAPAAIAEMNERARIKNRNSPNDYH